MNTDQCFLAEFEARQLPAASVDHRAHLRLAWAHLQRHGYSAHPAFCAALKDFACRAGAPNKYHHTLSIAAMQLLAVRQHRCGATSFQAFAAKNPDLLSDFRGLIEQHYSAKVLASQQAKDYFVAPDLQPIEAYSSAR